MKPKARLEDWYYHPMIGCLIGRIMDHPRQEEFHAEYQMTSKVIRFEPGKKEAETENTVYKLGHPMFPDGIQ